MLKENIKILYSDENFKENYFNGEIDFTLFESKETEEITRFELSIVNNGAAKKIIPFAEVSNNWVAEAYMIPCVNYNGNEWGSGNEPKGMERDGKPWIFSSDRIGLPGCSVAENSFECTALFSSVKGISSNSSASVFVKDGKTIQRIYFSHMESPCVFLRKFVYGDAIVEFLSFEREEKKTFTFYLYNYKKQQKTSYYGYKKLFDYVNNGSFYKGIPAKYTAQTIKEWSGEFFRSLTEKYEDGYLSNMGLLPGGEHRLGDENSVFTYRNFGKYEIGWCGQNITAVEMYLRAYIETEVPDFKQKALGILDNWMKRIYPCGLISSNYDVPFDYSERIDTCNEGWLLYKLVFCCRLLKQIGVKADKYESAIKGICNFFIERYPTGGFPQILFASGEVSVLDGCAGVMVMLGFIEAYKYFNNEEYIARATGAFNFYYDVYLSKSVSAGGALDTYCIDKESSGPILRSALLLYELKKENKFLEYADNIAHYLMTWAFYHDVHFDDNTDCSVFGVKTTGGTSVSAAHHHIDCWALFYVPDMYKLYEITGERHYLIHARALWTFAIQYISDGTMKLHGMLRPRGAQNEAVIQCNWHHPEEERGQLNDWLVAWVKSFQLDVIYALKDTDFFKESENEKV